MAKVGRVKTRPPEGPRYTCGHRAYVSSARMVAAVRTYACADCRAADSKPAHQ